MIPVLCVLTLRHFKVLYSRLSLHSRAQEVIAENAKGCGKRKIGLLKDNYKLVHTENCSIHFLVLKYEPVYNFKDNPVH